MVDEKAFTVSELTREIKNTLEPKFCNISLQGEISNYKKHSSGHLYFSLKDQNAQISAAMFYPSASKLKIFPKDGDQVLVKGDVTVYPPRGNYQIVVRELYHVGVGELLLRLEELKKEIHRRGWFSQKYKKPLPKMPKKIGIVTSPTGAAIQDMLKVLGRRFYGLHVILNPVRVQGEGAAEEIARAIEQFNEHRMVDVIIVGRGGGSIEDLWAFNEEIVAAAIFHSEIPIIGAVGHETDHSIAEYVADLRAPTPSAACEMVVAEQAQLAQNLSQLRSQLLRTMRHILRHGRQQLAGFYRQPFFRDPYALLAEPAQRVDELKEEVEASILALLRSKGETLGLLQKQLQMIRPLAKLQRSRELLRNLFQQLVLAWINKRKSLYNQLRFIEGTLQAIDPKNLLSKGYSILYSEKDGSVITSIASIEINQKVRMLLADGEAVANVEEKRKL